MAETFQWHVGIDWGSDEHQVCVIEGGQLEARRERAIKHEVLALSGLADWLSSLAAGDASAVAVAIETPRGAVVELLVERGFAVFAINPKQLDRFRDRHTVAGAKDDRLDAFVLADSLRTDPQCFRRVRLDDPLIIQLRELSRVHDELAEQQVADSNRLQALLSRYFLQPLTLVPAANEPWLWALLTLAATPLAAARLTPGRVAAVLRKHRIRRYSTEDVVAALRAPALRVAPGTVEAVARHVALLLPRLQLTHEQSRQVERELDGLLDALAAAPADEDDQRGPSDVAIVRSVPGIGPIVGASLLGEAWQLLRARDLVSLRAHTGAGPVTRKTGKSGRRTGGTVLMRYACNDRLRNALYHWSRVAIQRDPRARALYARHRGWGQRHGRALRAVGDRLLAMLIGMLRTRTLYDPARRQPQGDIAAAFQLAASTATA